MIKGIKHSYRGINQDISKSKMSNEYYFEGNNIRIVSTDTQSTRSVTNEKGNALVVSIPTPTIDLVNSNITYNVGATVKTLPFTTTEIDNTYSVSGTQRIIGHGLIRENIILFTTDNNGIDCIWKVEHDSPFDITLLYLRNLGFNTAHPIQAISNYENEIIDKVYWVDGNAQMRFVNIHHAVANQDLEELINLSFNNIQMVGTFDVDQPEVIDVVQGGIHTAGMIQYGYNMYRINGSQTKISPLTDLVPLDKGTGNGGGELNEIVGSIPVIKVDTIDHNYTHLRLYAIKYTSYNQIPSVSLILDRDITGVNEVTYYDDGNIIEEMSIEEFSFLGSDIIIPKHINTKKNIMFFANYKEQNFDVNTYSKPESIDTRAYSFPISSSSVNVYDTLYDNAGTIDGNDPVTIDDDVISGITTIDYKHSTINSNYDINAYQYNSTVIGGEGPYIKYSISRDQVGAGITTRVGEGRFLKDNEIYRLGIQFYNKYGQISLPKWIADFKTKVVADQSNLSGWFAYLDFQLKPAFYLWLNTSANFLDENGVYDDSLKPVGYRLLRAERTMLDKTIICQGLINGMLSQVKGDTSGNNSDNDASKVNAGLKIPSMMRRFDDELCPMYGNESYKRVDRFDPENHPNFDPTYTLTAPEAGNEVYKAQNSDQWSAGTFQYTQMMQMFSPEILFNMTQTVIGTSLNPIGALKNDANNIWVQSRNTNSKIAGDELKTTDCISPYDVKASLPGNLDLIKGSITDVQSHGFFAHDEGAERMVFAQTYRKYTGNFDSVVTTPQDIYGDPIIVEKGQGRTTYNNDTNFEFSNSLEPLVADAVLNYVNSWGARNVTFVLGDNITLPEDRITIEGLRTSCGITDTDIGIVAELRIPEMLVYLGNIYGGNTYEAKKRTNYIEVGNFNDINVNNYTCFNFGDTFVQNFRFTKLCKTDTEVYTRNSEQVTEIVEFRVETCVDLLNRHDESLHNWDADFQPRYDEYQKYNKVYSQDPNLILRRDFDYKFKRVSSYDTNIISTRIKVPGEVIDSWTDLQPNNTLTLDGKHGPINSLHSFRDEIYTLQDSGIAFISILPRIQVTGSDGMSVELGTGSVLQEYKYISNNSGTKNKWSVVSSPSGFYYFDLLNRSINVFDGQVKGLSDGKGVHTFMINNTVPTLLEVDNPIINSGVTASYDFLNNDVFFTFHQGGKSFTRAYNEGAEAFTSLYDYKPSMYISKGDNFLTVGPSGNTLYKQYAGEYNNFYGTIYPSWITLLVNPEQDADCTFNNIEYKSEVYINGIDQPNSTLTKVQLTNEYQDSSLRDLVLRENLSRKFRIWRITLPRQNNSRDRIRNPWTYIKLQFDNSTNKKLVLHDTTIYYNV